MNIDQKIQKCVSVRKVNIIIYARIQNTVVAVLIFISNLCCLRFLTVTVHNDLQ